VQDAFLELTTLLPMSETTPATTPTTTSPVGSVAMVTIDCADATELATFYSRLLGMTIAYQDENVAMITGDSGPALGFGNVDHYTPPPWPDENSQKQFHLDLKVADIAEAEAASQELGATRPDFQPGGDGWRVMLDPAGHPFCLALWQS
jgi:catechol 2,3-dioxygenase-like lactoylglutathione lyase family enzyme